MRSSSRILLILLTFVFLMTKGGTHGFSSAELAHDFDYHRPSESMTSSHIAPLALDFGANPMSEPLGELEHHLLHALSTLHLLVNTFAGISWNSSKQKLTPASGTPSLPQAEIESPFRPPRSSAFI